MARRLRIRIRSSVVRVVEASSSRSTKPAADSFLPGDTGPFGTVGPHGAFYDFVGRIAFTIDASGATTQFSWRGTATDICAALS